MAVTRTAENLLHGVANIYFGDRDEVLPDEAATDYDGDWTEGATLSWEGVGYTEDGVELESSVDTEDISPSETTQALDTLVTGTSLVVRCVVMEHTIEMMKLAFGGGTLTTTAAGAGQIGKTVLTLSDQLDAYALGFEVEVGGFWERVHIPHVKSVANVGTGFALNKIRMFPLEFRALCRRDEITVTRKTANATS